MTTRETAATGRALDDKLPAALPPFDRASARRLLDRTARVPFFAHSYSFCHQMEHGRFGPRELLHFAAEHGLLGVDLHINDGAERSLSRMSPADLDSLAKLREQLGLRLHLEISSTERHEIDRATELAAALGVRNIRLYARRHGKLSEVMEAIYADLSYACERAPALDLHFDYEQHEDLKAAEIVSIVERIGNPRLNVLFDYANSLNAHEEPLEAFRILAPYIRQVHIKGARKTLERNGWGHLGVRQGSAEDEMPGALLLFNLLMLGEDAPQVISFALEQEVGYYAPPFRESIEAPDPVIAAREPSETPLDTSRGLPEVLAEELRLAIDQIAYNRGLADALRSLATETLGGGDEQSVL